MGGGGGCQVRVIAWFSCLACFCQLERLVTKRGSELRAPGCDSALDLIEAILEATEAFGGGDEESRTVRREIHAHIHNVFSTYARAQRSSIQ